LYVDDQVVVAESNDKLQMAVNELNKIIKKYEMTISLSKTKVMIFCEEKKHKKGQTKN
jgi:hypothetical protein